MNIQYVVLIICIFLITSCSQSKYNRKNMLIDEEIIFSDSLQDGTNITLFRFGSTFIASNDSINFPKEPAISGLGQGRFIISFTGNTPLDPNGTGILGTEFDEFGNRTTPIFLVNNITQGSQIQSNVQNIDLNRTFNSVWSTNSQIISGQNFLDPNTKFLNEFIISNLSNSTFPISLSLSNQIIFSVFSREDSILGTIYSFNQSIIKSLFFINEETSRTRDSPSSSRVEDGNYVVLWSQEILGPSSTPNIIGQFFNSANNKIGNNIIIAPGSIRSSFRTPQAIALPENIFFLGWVVQPNSTGVFLNLEGQLYDDIGNSIDSIFRINEEPLDIALQPNPTVSELSGTGISIWCWTNSNAQIVCKAFVSNVTNITSIGPEFNANNLNFTLQSNSVIANISDEKFSVCFEQDFDIACQLLRVEIRRPTLPPFGPINGGGSAVWSLGVILGVGVPLIIIIILIFAILIGFKKASSDADDDGNTVTLPLQRFQ